MDIPTTIHHSAFLPCLIGRAGEETGEPMGQHGQETGKGRTLGHLDSATKHWGRGEAEKGRRSRGRVDRRRCQGSRPSNGRKVSTTQGPHEWGVRDLAEGGGRGSQAGIQQKTFGNENRVHGFTGSQDWSEGSLTFRHIAHRGMTSWSGRHLLEKDRPSIAGDNRGVVAHSWDDVFPTSPAHVGVGSRKMG